MRILIANWRDTSHPRAGGAEVYTDEVCARLVERGHDVTWFSAAHPNNTEEDTHRGIRRIRRGGTYTVYREGRRHVAASRGQYDIIVDQVNTVPFRLDRVAGDTPVCYLSHQLCREIWNTDMPLPAALVGRYIAEPWWLSRMRRLPTATVSPSSQAELEAAGFTDVVNLGEGIDREAAIAGRSRRGPQPKADRPTVLYLGRHAANKRPLHLIEAGARILDQVPGAQVWLAGSGPQLDKVREQASWLNEFYGEGSVTVHGRVTEDEKYQLMEKAWCLVVPSVREGWALVVDEAAAVGTRSVGYPVPGLIDSVPAAGGVIAEQDTPQALAEAVIRVLGEEQHHAGKVVDGWVGGAEDWEVVASRFEAYLEEIINNPRHTPGRTLPSRHP